MHRAALGGQMPGGHPQQRGFSRAIRADHPGPACGKLDREIGEERRGHAGMGKLDGVQRQLGGRHIATVASSDFLATRSSASRARRTV